MRKKKKKSIRQQITEGVKKAASKVKKGLQIVYNRSTRQWERPKYMRKAEFERQLAEKEALYVKRRARDVQRLIDLANNRVSQLLASGLESDAMRKLDLAGRDSYYFSTEGKNKEELTAEIQMVRDFIQNPTSTITGAEQFTRELLGNEWKEIRGGSYEQLYEKQAQKVKEEGGFENFNERIIKLNEHFYTVDNEQAKLAFAAYRAAMEGGLAAEGMYDSENLIAYSFAYVENNGLSGINDDNMIDIGKALKQYVDERKKIESEEFKQAFRHANSISAIVADEGELALQALGIK